MTILNGDLNVPANINSAGKMFDNKNKRKSNSVGFPNFILLDKKAFGNNTTKSLELVIIERGDYLTTGKVTNSKYLLPGKVYRVQWISAGQTHAAVRNEKGQVKPYHVNNFVSYRKDNNNG